MLRWVSRHRQQHLQHALGSSRLASTVCKSSISCQGVRSLHLAQACSHPSAAALAGMLAPVHRGITQLRMSRAAFSTAQCTDGQLI